jgi:uncharacterized membrane protein
MDLTIDILALGVFGFSIVIYSIMLVYGLQHPDTSRKGAINAMYKHYVDARLKKSESPVVAVQAMRNLIMANSAFISALLILLGLLLASYSFIFPEDLIPGTTISLGYIQMLVMILIIIFCLFNFMLAIRMLVRFTILISSYPDEIKICGVEGLSFTKETLISAQNHWTFGLRGLFYLITVLAWLAHPLLFLLGSIGVTGYLVFIEDIYAVNTS